jgi:hypothetical protein
MKRYLLLLLFFSFFINSHAFQLSKSATFSLLTNTPGDELYSMFGHSAIRLNDSIKGIDLVFNYGTFNFGDPGFYYKFVKGKLKYFLSVETYGQYLWGRNPIQSVIEQKLNLTQFQKMQLFQFLQRNMLPENKYYLYDFFYDNCSTRIPDALKLILRDSISFSGFKPDSKKSYRQLIKPYIKKIPWVHLGIDLALGLPADVKANPEKYMFLPEHLKTIIGLTTINKNDTISPLVLSTKTVAEASKNNVNDLGIFTPALIFWIIFIFYLSVSVLEFLKKKVNFWIDRIIFGITGLTGAFILFLWLGTDHLEMKNNLNVLWAIPLHVAVIFFLKNIKYSKILRYYFLINALICIILLITWPVFPQQFHYALIPIILALLTRSLRLFHYYSSRLELTVNG